MKRIGPRLSKLPAGTRNVPQPHCPFGLCLRSLYAGQDRGGQWGEVGSYAGYFELKKGDLEWGFRAPEMETEKGDSWESEGETPENPERHEALRTREAHGAPAQGAHLLLSLRLTN